MYVSIKDTSSEAHRYEDLSSSAASELPDEAAVIEQAVLKAFDLPLRSLRSRQRGQAHVAFARQVAIYVAHVYMGMTLTKAARLFGRDRTTAAYACRIVEDKRDDRRVDLKVEAVERALENWIFPVEPRALRSSPRLMESLQ
ncbi:helix-turn-helix domain-containing protein [Oryzibacter oryziterrae]|uniref:helix-turn-helix domain-containing protein n=1 Tax=Oryzibacter oryziterrae TaxID=2766474 RepID=UPI001F202922|nr:helix-turn-helix domain-containing protein [Oryzibacter oryziterrae]